MCDANFLCYLNAAPLSNYNKYYSLCCNSVVKCMCDQSTHFVFYLIGLGASAIFDGKGIKGYINFTMVADGIRIQTSLQGLVGKVIY